MKTTTKIALAAGALLAAAAIARAAIPSTQASKPVVMEGASALLTLGPFTREDGKTPVVPDAAYCRVDRPAPSATQAATNLLPTTTFPALAATVTMTLPASVNRFVGVGISEEEHVVQCEWEWWPGTCSSTITTDCTTSADCPSGELCEARKGNKAYAFIVRRRPFQF